MQSHFPSSQARAVTNLGPRHGAGIKPLPQLHVGGRTSRSFSTSKNSVSSKIFFFVFRSRTLFPWSFVTLLWLGSGELCVCQVWFTQWVRRYSQKCPTYTLSIWLNVGMCKMSTWMILYFPGQPCLFPLVFVPLEIPVAGHLLYCYPHPPDVAFNAQPFTVHTSLVSPFRRLKICTSHQYLEKGPF